VRELFRTTALRCHSYKIVSQLFWLALHGSLTPSQPFLRVRLAPERPSDGRSGECRSATALALRLGVATDIAEYRVQAFRTRT
jgi:hypothetical protein